jgi:predicted nuclease of predicted toxin-antitoxin system
VVAKLRDSGHDVVYIVDAAPSARDRNILELAKREERLLLTEDKDFGELVIHETRRDIPGLALMRVRSERAQDKWARLSAALDLFGERLFGHYLVIDESRIRARLLNPSTDRG